MPSSAASPPTLENKKPPSKIGQRAINRGTTSISKTSRLWTYGVLCNEKIVLTPVLNAHTRLAFGKSLTANGSGTVFKANTPRLSPTGSSLIGQSCFYLLSISAFVAVDGNIMRAQSQQFDGAA